MLHFIRERAQSWFAWVIVILIIIPFALWGVHQYIGGGGEAPAATVNGVDISKRQLEISYLEQRQRMQQMLGENFRPEMFPEERMRQQVLQDLIEKEILVTTAGQAGFRIGNTQLAETIRAIPALQENGSFSNAAYERALSQKGMSPAMFEQRMRRDLVAQQFYTGISDSVLVTQRELQEMARLQNQTRDIGYMLLPLAKYEDGITIDDAAISQYYADNQNRFQVPEEVSISYLELNADEIAKGIKVSEEELHARYDSQSINYVTPEERRARHILIQVAQDADAAEVDKAKQTLLDIRQRIEKGESFADLAKQYSQDPGSAAEGGDLGFFGHGIMDPAFEESAFSLAKGELSEPVRSAFGWHLIQIEEIKPAQTKSFEAVHDQLLEEIRNERADQLYYDQADKLSNLTYEHPDTLETAAEELGLTVKSTGLFPRNGGSGLAANPKVNGAAFSDEVLLRGNNSEPVELSPNHTVVLRVKDHKAQSVRPLEEVKPMINSILVRQEARKKAEEVAGQAMQRLQAGDSPETLAKELGSEWQKAEQVGRAAKQPDTKIVQFCFTMPHPEGDKPSIARTTTTHGDEALIALYGVKDGELADSERKAIEGKLYSADSSAEFSAVLEALRARSDISMGTQ